MNITVFCCKIATDTRSHSAIPKIWKLIDLLADIRLTLKGSRLALVQKLRPPSGKGGCASEKCSGRLPAKGIYDHLQSALACIDRYGYGSASSVIPEQRTFVIGGAAKILRRIHQSRS